MKKHKKHPKKQEILHWNIRNNDAMPIIAGRASTGKSSVLKLMQLRKEYLSGLPKPLNEQVIIDRPCSAGKIAKEINKKSQNTAKNI